MQNTKLLPVFISSSNFSDTQISKSKIDIDSKISNAITEFEKAKFKLSKLIYCRDILHACPSIYLAIQEHI